MVGSNPVKTAHTIQAQGLKRKGMNKSIHSILAIIGGVLLALMITLNSLLGSFSSPLYASWVAHGVGAIVALILVQLMARRPTAKPMGKEWAPYWSYLAGIPGAAVVAVAAITVNSKIGLTGTLALGIVGQIIFGLLSDQFGWFGLPKRSIRVKDVIVLLMVLSGSGLIIFSRGSL
jgi:transporter family-2 protein